MQFFLQMIPPTATAQGRRWGAGGRTWNTPEIEQAKGRLLQGLARHTPREKLTGPIRLVSRWMFPAVGCHAKDDGKYKDTRPDCDNITKMFQDCMSDCHFWHNDAQVASLTTEKYWSKTPGIWVFVESINQP